MRARFDKRAYNKMSKHSRILFWCYLVFLLACLAFYVLAIFPKTQHHSLRSKPETVSELLARQEQTQHHSIRSKPEIDPMFSMIWYLFVPLGVGSIVCAVLDACLKKKDRQELDNRIRGLDGKELTADEFLASRAILRDDDFTGVYVLHNTTKDLYYVGQSVHVWKRLAGHLMGHGNADVYADKKYGDLFTIKVIPLVGSGYKSLNDLERDTITSYDAYEHGYNRTSGNSR